MKISRRSGANQEAAHRDRCGNSRGRGVGARESHRTFMKNEFNVRAPQQVLS